MIATGARSYFGKTAELVRTATTVSHLQTTILSIVKYLVMIDGVLVLILLLYSQLEHLPMMEMLPFALMLLMASVPVALPATFTLATALGSMELARSGVLVTRLSAIEEAAAMEALCSDKTGTITQNRISVTDQRPYAPYRQSGARSPMGEQPILDVPRPEWFRQQWVCPAKRSCPG